MHTLLSFFMAVLPAVLLVVFYYSQCKERREPRILVVNVFLLGIFSAMAVGLLSNLVNQANVIFEWSPFFHTFFEAFIVAGLCEEYIKLQIVKNYPYCKPSFDEVTDGIVYTIVASMGFACMENILYVTNTDWHTAIARGFTAVPLHAVCSGLMGYYVGRAKFAASKGQEKQLIYQGLWQAVTIHGLYDFFLFISPVVGSIFSIVIVLLILWAYLRLRSSIRLAKRAEAQA